MFGCRVCNKFCDDYKTVVVFLGVSVTDCAGGKGKNLVIGGNFDAVIVKRTVNNGIEHKLIFIFGGVGFDIPDIAAVVVFFIVRIESAVKFFCVVIENGENFPNRIFTGKGKINVRGLFGKGRILEVKELGEKRTGGVIVCIVEVCYTKVAVAENYGVCRKLGSRVAENSAIVSVISTVYPEAAGNSFAGNVAFIVRIRTVIAEANAGIDIGKTGDIKPADNVVVDVESFCKLFFS